MISKQPEGKVGKTILIDMDETLYDFKGSIESYQYGPPEMLKHDFFKNLELYDFAEYFVKALYNRGYDIHICTKYLATKPDSCREKVEAIQRDFPYLWDKIILCQDKNMLSADYLVDDNDSYCSGNFNLFKIDPEDPEKSWEEFVLFELEEGEMVSQYKDYTNKLRML